MNSLGDQQQLAIQNHDEEDEESFMQAMHLVKSSILPMVLNAAIDLDLLEIIAKSESNKPLSAFEIASQLPAQNPDAPALIGRILRLLASHSILKCTHVTEQGGNNFRELYSLSPVGKYLTKNEDGVSLAPYLAIHHVRHAQEMWYRLKDAVIEGETPFYRVYGVHLFDEFDKETQAGAFCALFNKVMYNNTQLIMKKVLEKYTGFESLKEVVDVGGGYGASLRMIVSKHPHIKGINFDLPSVIKEAPTIPGICHVEGDMFTEVPKAEAIFLKWVLHDWNDDKSIKILKNCYNALPKQGKVIVLEVILPKFPETDIVSKSALSLDLEMMLTTSARERRKEEYESLAIKAGFEAVEFVCCVCGFWVIECYK